MTTTPTTPAPDSPWTQALARLVGALDVLTDSNLDEAELLRVHHDAFGALTEAYEYGVQTGIDRVTPGPGTLEAISAGLTAEQAARAAALQASATHWVEMDIGTRQVVETAREWAAWILDGDQAEAAS